jgi:hypothetical protein
MEASSSVLAVVWTEKLSIFFRNQNRNLEVLTPGETQLRTATTRNERSCVEGWILWGREDFYWWFWWFTLRINKWFAPHQASLSHFSLHWFCYQTLEKSHCKMPMLYNPLCIL